jgi:uncharacterized membrane protein
MKQKKVILIVLIISLGVAGAFYAFKTGQLDAKSKVNEELNR